MIVFQNYNKFQRANIDLEDYSVSTLLIPKSLMDDFLKRKAKCNGNTSSYFKSLLRRFRTITLSGLLPEPSKIKTEYQNTDLDLQKVNFRPRNSDWIELGELALAFGKSRCYMFIYLLKLDLLGLWKILVEAGLKKIVPTTTNFELESFILLNRVSNHFARGYHVKV